MSRCVLDNEKSGAEVVVGWDCVLNTFFAQVIIQGGDDPIIWLGTVPGQFLLPERVIEVVSEYACSFDRSRLIRELMWDKVTNSERIYCIDDIPVEELDEEEVILVNSLLGAIIGNNKLSTPVYCPEVKSEADAEAMAGKLPMIYIWNENGRVGSYIVTINGKYIGSVLEKKVPRTEASFVRIRDAVLYQLREIATKNINATCSMLKIMPSIAFAKQP